MIKANNRLFKFILVAAFGVLLILAAIFTFNQVRKFTSTWNMTALPGLALTDPTPTLEPGQETPIDSGEPENPGPLIPAGPQPEPWDGASRVTLLVMGLDYNDWRLGDGPPRTDTMILLTLDPLAKTAGMLSIPRDMWVNVPGFGYYKINQAYQLGEADRLPGGGPELARRTVEQFLGVPIQYYAQVDFSAFVRFIDEIGGVKLDVAEEVSIDIYDDDRGAITISPGIQTLPGEYALAYARARSTEGGDFDRAERQQQVVMGIFNRLVSFDMIPTLVTKAPTLYNELSSGVKTNLALDEIIQLAWTGQSISQEEIRKGIIGPEQVNLGKSPDGLDILKPLPDQIRLLRDYVFTQDVNASPVLSQNKEPLQLAVEEAPQLSLLNGTLTAGMAGLTSEYFQDQGFNVIFIGDADNKPHIYTSIYDYTGNPYAVKYFVELMNISQYRVFYRYAPESEVDVTIILGDDWVGNNPMP